MKPTLGKQVVKIKHGGNNLFLDFSLLPRSCFPLFFSVFFFLSSIPLFLPFYFPSFLFWLKNLFKKKYVIYFFLAVLVLAAAAHL